MNKKSLIVVCGLLLASTASFAQKSKIKEANKAYDNAMEYIIQISALSNDAKALDNDNVKNPLLKAKAAIDEAVANPETSGNADAWAAKANIYVEMSRIQSFNDKNYYNEALEAMEKAYAINPKILNKYGIENTIFNTGIFAFNGGINELSEQKYDDMITSMTTSKKALTFADNKLFKDKKDKDTLVAQAEYYVGYAQYLKKDYKTAIATLESAIKNPITNTNIDAHRILSYSYGELKQFDKQIASIEAARKQFPNNKDIEVDELNYYVSQGKESVLVEKFEQAVAKEPNNATYLHNLGVLYKNMGNEKEITNAKNVKETKFPSDAHTWFDKSEVQFKKAVSIEPNNTVFSYSLAHLYIVRANEIGDKMNNLGTSKADDLKYNEYVVVRNGYLNESLKICDKIEERLEPLMISKKINAEDKGYFLEVLQTKKRIYGGLSENEKLKAVREKLEKYENM